MINGYFIISSWLSTSFWPSPYRSREWSKLVWQSLGQLTISRVEDEALKEISAVVQTFRRRLDPSALFPHDQIGFKFVLGKPFTSEKPLEWPAFVLVSRCPCTGWCYAQETETFFEGTKMQRRAKEPDPGTIPARSRPCATALFWFGEPGPPSGQNPVGKLTALTFWQLKIDISRNMRFQCHVHAIFQCE